MILHRISPISHHILVGLAWFYLPRRCACSDKQSDTSSYSSIKVFRLLKEEEELVSQLQIEQAEEFNGQFTDVFNKSNHSEVPFLSRSAPFMDDVEFQMRMKPNFYKV